MPKKCERKRVCVCVCVCVSMQARMHTCVYVLARMRAGVWCVRERKVEKDGEGWVFLTSDGSPP